MKTLLKGLIRCYQILLSPIINLFMGGMPCCRFKPTCSRYALEAIEIHGSATGSWLTLKRILRCHPWGGHGDDPVPPKSKQATSSETNNVSCKTAP